MKEKKEIKKKSKEAVDLSEKDEARIELKSDKDLTEFLRKSIFTEGIHYTKKTAKNGELVFFFKKQASSILRNYYNLNVSIKDVVTTSYIKPTYLFYFEKVFLMIENLMKEEPKKGLKLLNLAESKLKTLNRGQMFKVKSTIVISDKKSKVEWTATAIDAMENVAVSKSLSRAFRNGVRTFKAI